MKSETPDNFPQHYAEELNLGSQTISVEVASEISSGEVATEDAPENAVAPAEVEVDFNLDFKNKEIIEATPAEVSSEAVLDLAAIAKMVPDKMGFKIGDVAEIAGIKPYVLRYWESEFDALNPQKSAFNQRMYSKKDVETVLLIKKLLYDEKFSIAGAKKKIREVRKELKAEKQLAAVSDKIGTVSSHLQDLVEEIGNLKSMFQS